MSAILLLVVCAIALLTVVFPLVLGAQSYTVLTGSMRPHLEPGALIAVRPVDAADVRVGDVITFQLRSGEPDVATHRVVAVGVDGIGERVFTTRGDANDTSDAHPVRPVQIRGVLVYAMPWIGYVNLWATPAIKSLLVAVIGIGAIVWGAVTLLKDTARRRRAASIAAAGILLAGAPVLGTAVSADASAQNLLQVSADGTTWSTGPSLTVLDGTPKIVPGDTLRTLLWVRSTASDPGDLSATLQWYPSDPSDPRDTRLAQMLTAHTATVDRLDPGQVAEVDVIIALDPAADGGTRNGAAELVVTLHLTQNVDDALLPPTGAGPPVPLVLGAMVLLAAGAVLVISRRRRR